ncbi:MAG: AAA family ATPase [Lachnospiraceae bacterium]|nr:AAA family ATPase [Lachnospiraceae bacterium]MDD7434900.1 AAA family ATPase [Lachnospiraceae bacterium]MDY3341598.1 AAA family ATPase [Lachnospiraceae bacterium]
MNWMDQMGIRPELQKEVAHFRERFDKDTAASSVRDAAEVPRFHYLGKDILEKAICALLCEKNLLLTGPKATGKNVLAENLAWIFGRPCWNVSFHINVDASYLIGTDTFDGEKVVFRPGPVYQCARYGGFGILDEINMAKNEAMAVLHATLDYRRILDVSGYDRIVLHPAARFIGTMNYGYAGTRELNEALGSRFLVLQMPTISEKQLDLLLKTEYSEIGRNMCRQLSAIFYELDAKAESAEISPRAVDLRGLLDAVALMRLGLSPLDACDMGLTNKVFDATERAIIHDVIAARIPKSWN